MSIKLDLNPELEEILKSQAEQQGLSLSDYITQVLVAQSSNVMKPNASWQPLPSKEWAELFHKWVESFKHAPKLPPNAFKRESFYAEETG